MPVHEYQCQCGRITEEFRHPTQPLHRSARCQSCGGVAELCPSMFNTDGIPMRPHFNAGLGKWVKNTKDTRTNRAGVRVEPVGIEHGG